MCMCMNVHVCMCVYAWVITKRLSEFNNELKNVSYPETISMITQGMCTAVSQGFCYLQ